MLHILNIQFMKTLIQQIKEEGQRGVGREQYERKSWLLGRRGEKLNNSAGIVWDGNTLLMPYAPVGAKGL
jgi:hypothetical protein